MLVTSIRVALACLLVAESFLDSLGGLLLSLHLVGSKLSPELLELRNIALDIEGVVNNEQVLLIAAAGLECPVEGASEQESLVDNHELVVHVGSLVVIGPSGDAVVRKGLAIVALVLHALVIGDDANIDTLVLHVPDSVCEEIVGEVEYADQELRLGHLDIPFKLVDVLPVGEEEGVEVPGLRSVEIKGHLVDVLAQIGENFLVSVIAHL